jgi:hypothetical protein
MPDEGGEAILVDANLLIWAHHGQFAQHERAYEWWRRSMSGIPVVGIAWTTILAFLRVSTHPRALTTPLGIEQAWQIVDGWLGRRNVRCPHPTERHRAIFGEMLIGGGASANHTSDAHLAALAIEWGLVLQSADRDFARYPGLRWVDPLAT